MKRIQTLVLALVLALSLIPASAYDSTAPSLERTMSAGAAESFIIDGSGTLWAWGDNIWGQLGDGTTEDRSTPVKVLERVRSVSAGESHTYAVLKDNTLWAWGRNVSDAFPDSPDLVSSPVPVKIMDNVASASTGVCTHLAVKTDGTLWAWGKYTGNRSTKQVSTPAQVLDNVASVCAGYSHSLALKTDGTLWAWGLNNYGEVGDGTGQDRLSPVQVMDNVVSMSAGYHFSSAVKSDGSLWTWGNNGKGELGDGTVWVWDMNWDWHSPVPEEEALLQDTLASCIETWGPNVNRNHGVPTQVLDGAAAVYASNNNAYALRKDGTLWAWGGNSSGDIGDGTIQDRLSPVPVLDQVEQVCVGWNHVLARRTDGTLWTWGANLSGQLGSGESLFYGNYRPRFSAFPIQVMENLDAGAVLSSPAPGSRPASWASSAVDEAIANDFLPVPLRTRYNQTITRAQFCALAVQFYESFTGQEITGRTSFADTQDLNVEKAAYLGVVGGVSGGRFAPDEALNRAQAAVILTNLARALNSPLPQAAASFSDQASIGGWALDAVGRVQAAGIMSGTGGGNFSPQATYTREQSVVTIMNLYRSLTDGK